jgi:hypothetical protein
MYHTNFYCGSIIVCLRVVYEYESILVILTGVILLINMKFTVKYHQRIGGGVKGKVTSMWCRRGGMTMTATL